MKNILLLILLTFISCANKTPKTPRYEDQINALEVKTFKEINDHSQMLLDGHPELSAPAKKKIKEYLADTMKEHQRLKDEESKVVQLLLQNSLSTNKESKTKEADSKELKKRFMVIYKEKSSNLFKLISHINQMSEEKEINDTVKRDVQLFMRDFR
jgi:hypothetical protein